ncbi:MAG: penicillin acylase family protein, partial [Janthinobacterium lividum]
MTRKHRILLGSGAAIGSVLLLGTVLIGGALWHTLPPTDQTLPLSGLHHPVSITIDEHGIPRIDAGDLVDAAVATGFLHARDRMFEMELMRRVGSG